MPTNKKTALILRQFEQFDIYYIDLSPFLHHPLQMISSVRTLLFSNNKLAYYPSTKPIK